jgi:hypothetical protein
MPDVGEGFLEFASKSLEAQSNMVRGWVLAKGRRGFRSTWGTRLKDVLHKRVWTKLRSRTAQYDCFDEFAEERMGCDLDKSVHAIFRLDVSAL